MASNEFSGRTLPCVASEQPSQSCAEFEGARILHASALGVNDYTSPCVALFVFWAVCITVGYVALVLIPRRSSMAGEGAALGAGASGAVEEKAYDLDAPEEGEDGVDSKLKQQKPQLQPQAQQLPQQLHKPQPIKLPLSEASEPSASGVVFIGGPDDSPIALSRPTSPERDLEAAQLARSASPLVPRAESPGRTVAASAVAVQVNGSHALPAPIKEYESRSLGVRRLSHDGHVSLRPLITLTLNNLCLSVVKRRALDLSCAGFGEGDAALSKAERNKPLKILNGVTATIEPGRLVVLMGSSGSGSNRTTTYWEGESGAKPAKPALRSFSLSLFGNCSLSVCRQIDFARHPQPPFDAAASAGGRSAVQSCSAGQGCVGECGQCTGASAAAALSRILPP